MAGNKCVYFKCGLSKRSDPTFKMYRFPVNDPTRCQKWIIHSGRLIQDPLENQFSVYRQRGGYNRKPTVKAFRATFEINIVANLMRSPRSADAGSQLDDDDNILLLPTDHNEALASLNVKEESSSEQTDSSTNSISSEVHSNDIAMLEVGYLIEKCLDRLNCKDCNVSLEASDEINSGQELLIFYKNYYLNDKCALKTPTTLLKNFTMIVLNSFDKNIGKISDDKIILNLKKKIVGKILPE